MPEEGDVIESVERVSDGYVVVKTDRHEVEIVEHELSGKVTTVVSDRPQSVESAD